MSINTRIVLQNFHSSALKILIRNQPFLKLLKRIFFINIILISIYCSNYQIYSSKDWEKKDMVKVPGYIWREFPRENKIGTVLLFDPIFLRKEALHPSSEPEFIPSDKTYLSPFTIFKTVDFPNRNLSVLIPYLNSKGFRVILISPENPTTVSLKKAGQDLKSVITYLENEDNLILGGVSLGGQAIAHYLSSGNVSPKIKKVFFMGTGLDYKYTGSLQTYIEKVSKKDEPVNCKISEKDNLCNRYITSLYIESGSDRRALSYPRLIPILEKEPIQFIGLTKLNLEVLLIYGKLDGLAPEESMLGLFLKGWDDKFKLRYFEASTASNLNHDYDHYDLFFHEDAPSEIYSILTTWMKRK